MIKSKPLFKILYKQDNDKQASGSFTINNLVKLALSDTNNFHIKDFQKLLSTSENIDQLRQHHDKLIHDYVTTNLIVKAELSLSAMNGSEREPFEHKGDWSESKEGHMSPPPYEEDNSVQMHILGENTES